MNKTTTPAPTVSKVDKTDKKGPVTKEYVLARGKHSSIDAETGERTEHTIGDKVHMTDSQFESFRDKFKTVKQAKADEEAEDNDSDRHDRTGNFETTKGGVALKPEAHKAGGDTDDDSEGEIGKNEEKGTQYANSRATARATGSSTDKPSGKNPT